METVCNKLEKCMMEVKVTFTTEEWQDAQKKALDKLIVEKERIVYNNIRKEQGGYKV